MTWVTSIPLVAGLGVLLDVLYAWWTVYVQQRRALDAALMSAGIQVVGLASVLWIIQEPWLLGANAAGHAFGTYVAVRWARDSNPDGAQDVRGG